eukprot:GFUD01033073.1.p1 GENE.GFUD01033073.1~~GFUD01033073.1.p1  ORF type:complete len:143 (+),score=33.02 GFUD01033073.1:165-593(+)
MRGPSQSKLWEVLQPLLSSLWTSIILSNLSTSIMYTSNTIVVIAVTLAIISGTYSLSWEKAEAGQLPPKAAKLYPNSRKPHCGQLTDTSPNCTYPTHPPTYLVGRKALTSTKFDVLVQGQETLEWQYGQSAPSAEAVRCDLE